jgi:DNA invertase Pin-like site-specific DNA recombinase
VRVSTESQAENGISLKEQRSRIKAYAAAHGLHVVRIASDNGVSGKTTSNRPGLLSALEDLDDAEAAGLVVCKLDRLSRTTTDILGLVERANRDGWQLHSIEEHLDTRSSHGRFVVGILSLLAQMEREQTAERTKTALAELKRQGKRISGKAPFGFRFDGDDVESDPEEQQILARILKLRAAGLGARRIARALNDAWIKNPRTRRWWTHGTIGDLVRTAVRRKS